MPKGEVARARLEAAKKNGDILALRALDRQREAAYDRHEVPRRITTARTAARSIEAGQDEGIGDEPLSLGPGFPDVGSGARPSRRDPHTLEEFFTYLAKKKGWTGQLEIATIMGQWERIVGPTLAQHLKVEDIDSEGTLTLRALSTTWETQARVGVSLLLNRLNEELGSNAITNIVILGPRERGHKQKRH